MKLDKHSAEKFKLISQVLRRTIPTEYLECKAYWFWAQTNPILKEYLIKNTNEGNRTGWFTKALLAIGMRIGLPDYHLPIANNSYHGLWIEMKRQNQKTNKKNIEQENWIFRLNKSGHYATFAYGFEDAMNITIKYLNNDILP